MTTFAAFHSVSEINGNVVPLPMEGVVIFSCNIYLKKQIGIFVWLFWPFDAI
jgi:hypothetical protein